MLMKQNANNDVTKDSPFDSNFLHSYALNLILNIRKFQCGYDLFITLCTVEDFDLASVYVDSPPR